MMGLDIAQLVTDMKNAASAELATDVSTMQGFVQHQLQAIGQQADMVARGIVSGEIGADTRDFFLQGIKDMALNFAKTLQGLALASVEKVWNAVVGVIWHAIAALTGMALAVPGV